MGFEDKMNKDVINVVERNEYREDKPYACKNHLPWLVRRLTMAGDKQKSEF
jgi:hypothetical protein